MKRLSSLVDIKGVNIHNGDKVVLQNIDFSLYDGEFCYVIGRTGSGKSSFLKSLYAMTRISGGSATILGQNLYQLGEVEIPYYRRKLGMVFQDIRLLSNKSVRENLDFVLQATDWTDEGERTIRIDEVLRQVDMSPKVDHVVTELSGGEQQKVAIARAILNKPKLILADEPTGNLDPESSEMILLLLRQLAIDYGASVILSTHDQNLLQRFPSRSYSCRDGSMTEL